MRGSLWDNTFELTDTFLGSGDLKNGDFRCQILLRSLYYEYLYANYT